MFIFFGQRNRIPAPKLEMLQLQVCRSCSGKYSDGRPGDIVPCMLKKLQFMAHKNATALDWLILFPQFCRKKLIPFIIIQAINYWYHHFTCLIHANPPRKLKYMKCTCRSRVAILLANDPKLGNDPSSR